jgi:hypothetical protein
MKKKYFYVTVPVENNSVTDNLLNPSWFVRYKIDRDTRKIIDVTIMENAPIDARKLIKWLAERLTDVLIFAGSNERVEKVCTREGIKLVSGVKPASPKKAIEDFLQESWNPGFNDMAAV